MGDVLKRGSGGARVRRLRRLLAKRGYPLASGNRFDLATERAVKAFQSQNLDQHGQPLVVDGRVGPLTWWSLEHPKPRIDTPSAVDFTRMPRGGSRAGRLALAAAIGELSAGAGEIGGDNRGPFVRKYLNGLAPEGSSWCAGFVSWCYHRAKDRGARFEYTVGARALLADLKRRGWAHAPGSGYAPMPGDVVVWWRVRAEGWQGHAGLVHQVRDGMLYTIEGNKSPRVQGFSYVASRMERLLGFGHVP
jgi:hypothetical protein